MNALRIEARVKITQCLKLRVDLLTQKRKVPRIFVWVVLCRVRQIIEACKCLSEKRHEWNSQNLSTKQLRRRNKAPWRGSLDLIFQVEVRICL